MQPSPFSHKIKTISLNGNNLGKNKIQLQIPIHQPQKEKQNKKNSLVCMSNPLIDYMKAVLVKLFATIFDQGANAPIMNWGITIGQVLKHLHDQCVLNIILKLICSMQGSFLCFFGNSVGLASNIWYERFYIGCPCAPW